MNTITDAKGLYMSVVDTVCKNVREALSQEGYDDQTIRDLETQWKQRLDTAKCLEPLPTSATNEATTRSNRRTTTNDNNHSAPFNKHPSTSTMREPVLNQTYLPQGMMNSGTLTIQNSIGPMTMTRPNVFNTNQNQSAMGNNPMRTSNQIDGSNDEIKDEQATKSTTKVNRRKKTAKVEISFQLDGTGPPVTDDDEDEDDDNDIEGNGVVDDIDDDDDDDGNEEGTEDSRPLCSDDDVSDEEEPAELFDADNVVVCQYEKISRTKNKWRFTLKSGVMSINGHDFVFSKATGEAEW